MIQVLTLEGELLRTFGGVNEGQFGGHPLFGLISERTLKERSAARKRKGLRIFHDWAFLVKFELKKDLLSLTSIKDCTVAQKSKGEWLISTSAGDYLVKSTDFTALPHVVTLPTLEKKDRLFLYSLLATALIFLFLLWLLMRMVEVGPSTLELMAEKHKAADKTVMIEMPKPKVIVQPMAEMPKEISQVSNAKQVGRLVKAQMGFLGMLGRKDLKGAIGGAPTELKQVTAGAGPGGTGGSGGEFLSGLGKGVKQITVGNTGVAGLGGVNTKGGGAGGGAGGYGNSLVASGEGGGGRGISQISVSQDMILEGGLDRYVINATIAKYLNQVRACYESQLKVVPGLTGQVTMDFEIGGSGALNYSKVAKSSLGNSVVEGCIKDKMMSWKFPAPKGGVNVHVNYPFLLKPASV